MKCPNCGSENNESAKFCKKCGNPLKEKVINHDEMINSISNKSNDNTTKYIIVALVIIAVVLAGAFVYLYGFGTNQSNDSQQMADTSDESVSESEDEPAQANMVSESAPASSGSMSILGGSFSTGGGLEDKTYASIYVGPEHSGENVQVQIFYSRDGNALNDGNIVPKTVDSSGYIEVSSADSYKYFPDFADIYLMDSSGNLLDSKSVNLSPQSGTQSF